jgi:hypothetical protein
VRVFRPDTEGIREFDPKPRPSGPIWLTERTSPSIRTVRGWLFPLEHYDERLKLDILDQYVELLLIMGSARAADFESMTALMRQAHGRLDDAQYDRLVGYKALLESARIGIPAEVR